MESVEEVKRKSKNKETRYERKVWIRELTGEKRPRSFIDYSTAASYNTLSLRYGYFSIFRVETLSSRKERRCSL